LWDIHLLGAAWPHEGKEIKIFLKIFKFGGVFVFKQL